MNNEDDELGSEMREVLGNDMKFNIIFTVGQPQGYYDDENYMRRRRI